MATVPELKAQADELGITYRSKILKWELERMITLAIEAREVAGDILGDEITPEPAESATDAVTAEAAPTRQTPEERALAARAAGGRGKSAEPKSEYGKLCAYVDQRRLANENRSTLECRLLLTPRQSRRIRKAENRAKGSV